jgi:hypothetical protein
MPWMRSRGQIISLAGIQVRGLDKPEQQAPTEGGHMAVKFVLEKGSTGLMVGDAALAAAIMT